jgi:hypothetical protein
MKSWQRVGAVMGAGLVAAFGMGCAEDGGRLRTDLGGALAAAGSGPSDAGQIILDGSGGSSAGSGGMPSIANVILGEPLDLIAGTGLVPYAIGPNIYNIRGGGFLARAAQGNTVTVANEPGKICISGNLEEVPNGNYSQYWGVEFGFNLNQGTAGENGGAAPNDAGTGNGPTDLGADASTAGDAAAGDAAAAPVPEVALPWQTGRVIGFSFVIEGPTINLVRFKTLPEGYDSTLESSVFCKSITATSGAPQTALFSEITQYCWGSTSFPVPTTLGLDNIAWQLPADVAPAGERPFDWCLKDLRPILAP